MQPHPIVPDVVVIPAAPSDVVEEPTALPEVLVDRKCAEAVLRGADIFVRGLLGVPQRLHQGSQVAVNCDLERWVRWPPSPQPLSP